MAKKLILFAGIALLAMGILSIMMVIPGSMSVDAYSWLYWSLLFLSIGTTVAGLLLLIEGVRSDLK
jgi:hypothetical protein